MSLADLLFESDDPAGRDRPLVHIDGREHSCGDVADLAAEVACALADAGVAPGHAVGVMLPNGAELVATLFGVWRAGAVYVPLNPRLTSAELDHVLGSVQPTAIVTTDALAPAAGDMAVVYVDARSPDEADKDARGARPRVQIRPGASDGRRYDDDVALVQFTSGTTGAPKPVLLTHSGVMDLLDGVLSKLRGKPGDPGKAGEAGRSSVPAKPPMPNLIPVSLSLWAGIYNVLFALRVGAPVVVMDGFDPVEMATLVKRFDIRSTVLPPAAMTMLVDDERVTDLAPLRFVRSITAPLSPLQARRFKRRFGIAVLNSYGQTEIGGEIIGWNAADSREHGEDKLGSVGRPHRGVEVRVVDVGADGAVTGESDEGSDSGELWVRTPALSAGYADGTDLGDRLSPDGWFRTGDIGHIDSDGFVWIDGRVSDMINRGGLKVHPGEVEEVLRMSPRVADAAVVGVADERLGEIPWAFVVAAEGHVPDADALAALCRENLAPFKVPVQFSLIDALPRNEVGKVLTRTLAARAADGRPN